MIFGPRLFSSSLPRVVREINFFLMAQYKWFPDHVAFAALYGLAYIGYFFCSKKRAAADVSTNPSGHSLHPSGMSLKA